VRAHHGPSALLTKSFISWFDDRTRARGEQYFHQERVSSLRIIPPRVTARVLGSQKYTVQFVFSGDAQLRNVEATCDCPVGGDGVRCKHMWATLLAAEQVGFGKQLGVTPSKVKMHIGAADDADTSEERQDDETEPETIALKDAPSAEIQRALARLGVTIGFGGRLNTADASVPRLIERPKAPAVPAWLEQLRALSKPAQPFARAPIVKIVPWYVLELDRTREQRRPLLATLRQPPQPKRAGAAPARPKRLNLNHEQLGAIEGEIDAQICASLIGSLPDAHSYSWHSYHSHGKCEWRVPGQMFIQLLPRLVATGRFFARVNINSPLIPVIIDEGEPWKLMMTLLPGKSATSYTFAPMLKRADERLLISEFDLITEDEPTLGIRGGVISRVDAAGFSTWFREARHWQPQVIRRRELGKLSQELRKSSTFPPLDTPKGCELIESTTTDPRPQLRLSARPSESTTDHLEGTIEFLYGEQLIGGNDPGQSIADLTGLKLTRRNLSTEAMLTERLIALGVRRDAYNGRLSLPVKRTASIVSTLIGEGWTVLGGHHLFRTAGEVKIDASTGIDWFDVNGQVDFDGQSVGLPALLAALNKGEKFVMLGDGSMGILPEKWLAKNHGWLVMGKAEGTSLRFSKTQIGLIDALLAQMPDASCDAQLHAARKRLALFEGIKARPEPSGFVGMLRDYQREGLGWLRFLNEFGFGGCLADDMGLGKTVQLLGHIVEGRTMGERGAWLVVAPKSLMFNWAREAARFSPALRVVRSTGADRAREHSAIADADLVLTTYGTLRKDIEWLRKVEFAGVVLDEAQAVKNADSQSAKAARLLIAKRKLAMTGTPVENHLGDLWSIFDFLNPGMLGTLPAFRGAFVSGGDSANGSEEGRSQSLQMLSRAVRPFILRRTKEKVAPELPLRTEETVHCIMPAKQRKLYNDLRDHYRAVLLDKIDKSGLAKNKIHVLEALLRLRQAACHPGLIDPRRERDDSAKLESLTSMLDEAVDGGHKALVFSQFTSMLSIVRRSLDERKIAYQYLDGQTSERDRAAAVDRFQSDDSCRAFLISLKAGGFGLNLTAADYVFILDPWWNPAAEAQAIDRAHRIGQSKRVFAYRLIAEGTVESHIIELQKRKRALADAIIGGQDSIISSLTREDLATLLG